MTPVRVVLNDEGDRNKDKNDKQGLVQDGAKKLLGNPDPPAAPSDTGPPEDS